MKKTIKWIAVIAGILLLTLIVAIILIPQFVDVQKYKPEIEKLVMEQTGRSFSMGDDIELSVFPWIGISLSDLSLGNPKGFQNKNMVTVKQFEIRLKLMPLFSREIEVDTFVIDTPRIFLEKHKNDKVNWQDIGSVKKSEKKEVISEKEDKTSESYDGKLPITSLLVEKFSIVNGYVVYIDQTISLKKEVSDFNLTITDISFDKPIGIKLSAKVDKKSIALEGKAGPLGEELGKQDINFNFSLKALETLTINFQGKIISPTNNPKIATTINILPFSLRDIFTKLQQPFPIKTKDDNVLNNIALKLKIKANPNKISISNGLLTIDESLLAFLMDVKAFEKPDIKFDVNLNEIDVDRYLPPAVNKVDSKKNIDEKLEEPKKAKQKIDYKPLRKIVLDGKIKIGKLKVANIKIQDFLTHITAKNGVFSIDPLSLNLYQGNISSKIGLNVVQNNPKTDVNLNIQNLQVGQLLKDAIEKDMLEGTLKVAMSVNTVGETPDMIKKSLNGKGNIRFFDGAIVGIDLANMVRNATSTLGLTKKTEEKPRTDFTELFIPFSANNGIVNISNAKLASPLLRFDVKGDADIVAEQLDFSVVPAVVATLKGQGDTKEDRSKLMVPLLITGKFASPTIRPDLKAFIQNGVPNIENVKQMFKTPALDGKTLKQKGKEIEKEGKKLLKNLLPEGILNF